MDNTENNLKVLSPPQPVVLSNGKDSITVMIGPPTLSDLGAIMAKAMKHRGDSPLSRLVNDPCFSKLSQQAQVESAREVAKMQGNDERPSSVASILETITQPKVLSFAIWALARRHSPEISLDKISSIVTEDNADQIFMDVSEAAQMVDQLKNLRGLSG